MVLRCISEISFENLFHFFASLSLAVLGFFLHSDHFDCCCCCYVGSQHSRCCLILFFLKISLLFFLFICQLFFLPYLRCQYTVFGFNLNSWLNVRKFCAFFSFEFKFSFRISIVLVVVASAACKQTNQQSQLR